MKQLTGWLCAGIWFLVLSLVALGASSCGGVRNLSRSPEQQLQHLVAQHPELSRPDTVKVAVPFTVPAVEFQTRIVPVRDTVYIRQETSQLDSLLNHLQVSLDSAQKAATRAKIRQLLVDRPVLRDTLCFDTLGVQGKIWLQGRAYWLQIARKAIQDTARGSAAVQKLQGCPPAAVVLYSWYDPRGWGVPWWAWLLGGLLAGLVFAIRLRA